MPRILKSISLVENSENHTDVKPEQGFPLMGHRVIKGGYLTGQIAPPPLSTDVFALAPKDAYLDELNRIKTEIEQARAELRMIFAEKEAALEPEELFLEGEEADPTLLDEEIYRARQQEIHNMVLAAERKIADMTENAQAEARQVMEECRSQGYLEGFQKGYDEAVAEFKAENDPKAGMLADLIERLSIWEQQRLRDNEQEMLQLVTAISSKVVAREIETDPSTVLSMLTDAVMKNHREEYIRINLAEDLIPVDTVASQDIIDKLRSLGANITVKTTPGMPKGTIHMETPGGMIDMSVNTQLANIGAILADE